MSSGQDFDLSKADSNFKIHFEGTSMVESVKGSIKSEAIPKPWAKGNRVNVEVIKGNKMLVRIDSKIRKTKNIPALYFETKTKYCLMECALRGTMKAKITSSQLYLENELNGEIIELSVKVIPGESIDIETKKNEITIWTLKINWPICDFPG